MLGVIITSTDTNIGNINASTNTKIEDCYRVHRHQCWGLLLHPLSPMLGVVITSTDKIDGRLLLCPLTAMLGVIVLQLLLCALQYAAKNAAGLTFLGVEVWKCAIVRPSRSIGICTWGLVPLGQWCWTYGTCATAGKQSPLSGNASHTGKLLPLPALSNPPSPCLAKLRE